MTHYDYKVVPAPKRAKRVKGVHGAEELFALTLTDAINEVARQGWEYVRAEHLPAEAPRGWFRGGAAGEQTVLVFRRDRESLGPRLAAVRAEPADAEAPRAEPPRRRGRARRRAERAAVDRRQASLRASRAAVPARAAAGRGRAAEAADAARAPAPRLGPAEKSLISGSAGEVQRQRVHAAGELAAPAPCAPRGCARPG